MTGVSVIAAGCAGTGDQRAVATTTTIADAAPAELAVGANVTVPATLPVPDNFIAPDTRGAQIPPVLAKHPHQKDEDHSKPVLPVRGGTAKITGTVYGPDGAIEGATVRLSRFAGADWGFVDVGTNKDGKYEVDDLLGGRYVVRAWLKPDLATTDPQALFLPADHGAAALDIGVQKFEGVQLQGALTTGEPHVGERVNYQALLTHDEVDDNGVVQGAGVAATAIQLSALDGLKVFGDDVIVTGSDGLANFSIMCLTPGVHSVIIDGGGLAVSLALPACLDGTLNPDDLFDGSTTTTAPGTKATTTTKPTTTVKPATTTTTKPGGP